MFILMLLLEKYLYIYLRKGANIMSHRDISRLFDESISNLNLLIDSSKVVGKAIVINDDKMIIPISKITYGFGIGGSELNFKNKEEFKNELIDENGFPFGGGSLGGVNVTPIAFLVLNNKSSELIRIEQNDTLFDKILELVICVIKKSNKKSKE